MNRPEREESCPFSGGAEGVDRFALGPSDNRFAVVAGQPSHSVELKLPYFDASSEREPGGMLVAVHDGGVQLLGVSGRWTLPSGHMVFIPAERSYRLAASGPVHLTLVKFTGAETVWHHTGCWATAMPALAIEMCLFAHRWGPDRDPTDRLANRFFDTMGQLFVVWFDNKRKMWTPFGNAPDLERAIAFARDHIETASIADTAAAAGMSERTLRRRFQDELGISWREFINEIRMTEAMRLLGRGESSVTETAYAVGFNSLGAFTVAFSNYTGSTPSAYARSNARAREVRSPLTRSKTAGIAPMGRNTQV